MTKKSGLYLLGGVLVVIGVLIFALRAVSNTPEETETLVAGTQSVTEKNERYVGFLTPGEARTFEENIESGLIVGIESEPRGTRVFQESAYPVSRIFSSFSSTELRTHVAQHGAVYIEEIPEIELFQDWDIDLIQQVQTCIHASDTTLGIVDTHFDRDVGNIDAQIYYITEPGEGVHGTSIALLAGSAVTIAIDASNDDNTLPYAFEGLLLSHYLGVKRVLTAWDGDLGSSKTYQNFFEAHDDMLLISPLGIGSSGEDIEQLCTI